MIILQEFQMLIVNEPSLPFFHVNSGIKTTDFFSQALLMPAIQDSSFHMNQIKVAAEREVCFLAIFITLVTI